MYACVCVYIHIIFSSEILKWKKIPIVHIYTYIYTHTYIYIYIGINLPWPRIQSRGHIFPKEKVGDAVQVNALEDEEAGLVDSQPISATAGNWNPVTHACHSF